MAIRPPSRLRNACKSWTKQQKCAEIEVLPFGDKKRNERGQFPLFAGAPGTLFLVVTPPGIQAWA
jgi:hypothetical protein